MKNIWILNHYADPPNRQATRSYDLGKELVKRGYKVSIFASSFSHYSLKDDQLEVNKKWGIKYYNGVKFIWIKTFPYKKNDWRRILNMLSYAWRMLWVGIKLKEKPNIIIGTCVHPFAVLCAYILSKFKKSRFFFEVTDLWPQTLIEMGRLSEKSPVTLGLRTLEKFLYQKAEKIITLLPYANKYIAGLGISGNKVVWIPNGVDLSSYRKLKPYEGGISKNFTIMYLGGHSKYHHLETVLDVAKILQDERKNTMKFILIGDGLEKASLVKYSKKLNLQNVEFRNIVPKSKIAEVMGEADAFIYSFKSLDLLKYGMSPVKLFDYLSSQRPIIYAAKGANNPVEEARAGITVPPENPPAIVQAIKKLVAMKPEERIRMGKNGLEYIKKHHDIKILAIKLEKHLK